MFIQVIYMDWQTKEYIDEQFDEVKDMIKSLKCYKSPDDNDEEFNINDEEFNINDESDDNGGGDGSSKSEKLTEADEPDEI